VAANRDAAHSPAFPAAAPAQLIGTEYGYLHPVLRIRIEIMRMRTRAQGKISLRIQMRIHALTELWRAK
jgi:hypothetical protein